MIGTLDREKIDERKFTRQFVPHPHRDHLIVRAVKDRNFRLRIFVFEFQ